MELEIATLLQRIAQGEDLALTVLYAEYSRAVYSLSMQILRSEHLAQEVTQDVFMKVWHSPQAYDPKKGQFSSWLLTVTRFTAIDRLRHETRHTSKDVVLDDDVAGEPDDDFSDHDLARVRHVWEHVPSEQRQLIELAYFKGLTHSEMAQRLDLPIGTVKTRLRLGLQKLKGLLS